MPGGRFFDSLELPGFAVKQPARATTTAALPAGTWTATSYTVTAHGAFPAQDGVTLTPGDSETTGRLLVRNEGTAARNGLWYLQTEGTADPGGTSAVLVRCPDADAGDELRAGTTVRVVEGTESGLGFWKLITTGVIVIGTTALRWQREGLRSWQSEVVISPGNTINLRMQLWQAVQIQNISLWAATAPASALGTYLFTAADDSGTNLLAAASFDLETLVSGVRSSLALSATLGNRQLTNAEWAVFTFASTNADLVGAGLILAVAYYERSV